ncbi:hypothetical protein ACHAXR_006728 [Thalassiosira sp. AJA248-18]
MTADSNDPIANFSADGRPSSHEQSCDAISAGALRLLLVEEGNETNDCRVIGSLARSLAMDAAYSLAMGSSVPCRGCVRIEKGCTAAEALPMACRCCRIVMIIPGEPKKTKKKRRRNSYGSNFLCDTEKAAFPLSCIRDGRKDSDNWDPNLLGHIQIKYVTSPGDVIRYLTYAPSLPEHLQPLDGIFLLGMGELLSQENKIVPNVMELTHILSVLSDTANVLGDIKTELLLLNINTSSVHTNEKYRETDVSVVATIDGFTYQSIPQKVIRYLHHWIDFIAAIGKAHHDAAPIAAEEFITPPSEWELVFKNASLMPLPNVPRKSTEQDKSFWFDVKVCGVPGGDMSGSHVIIWQV